MVRVSLVAITLIVFFLLLLPLYLFLCLIGQKNPMLRTKIAQPVVAGGFRLVLFCAGTRVTVRGLENVPQEPVLFATNHRSFSDIPIFYTTCPHLTGIVAKKEIRKVPGLSNWMRLVNCIFLDRSDMKQAMKTVLAGIMNIKQGFSMCIMPEGTRNHKDELLPFKEGSFKMAEKTGCPIVPVAIWKSDEIFELHQPKVKKARITISYGKPINTRDLDKEEQKHMGSLVRSSIEKMLLQEKALFAQIKSK